MWEPIVCNVHIRISKSIIEGRTIAYCVNKVQLSSEEKSANWRINDWGTLRESYDVGTPRRRNHRVIKVSRKLQNNGGRIKIIATNVSRPQRSTLGDVLKRMRRERGQSMVQKLWRNLLKFSLKDNRVWCWSESARFGQQQHWCLKCPELQRIPRRNDSTMVQLLWNESKFNPIFWVPQGSSMNLMEKRHSIDYILKYKYMSNSSEKRLIFILWAPVRITQWDRISLVLSVLEKDTS